tara:strand:+ start:7398 stop:7892 length:495 start_codon:yes stop_codon:yes gene_type:complete
VNISLISYYFTGKDGLLNAILEELTEKGAQKMERLIEKFDSKQDFEERLKAFLSEMIHFYLDNSALIRLFLEELEKEQPEAEKVFSQTLFKTFDIFKKFLRDAAKAGFLRARTHDEQILMIQVLSPFMNLMKTKNCALKFYKTSLNSKTFRKDLIDQIIFSLIE